MDKAHNVSIDRPLDTEIENKESHINVAAQWSNLNAFLSCSYPHSTVCK